MVRYQKDSSRYYEGMFYEFFDNKSYARLDYRLGTSQYSEPRLVTHINEEYTWDVEDIKFDTITRDNLRSKTILGLSGGEEFGKYMNEEFTNMVNSVKKYGGFYVSRYEVSLSGDKVQSKPGQTPLTNMLWIEMYKRLDSNRFSSNPYYNNKKCVSSMIWNSQWNAILNWILRGPDAQYVTNKSIGNLTTTVNKTGETPTDCMNNIFDLSGNVAEYTQASQSTWLKMYRGSGINKAGDGYWKEGPSSNYYSYNPNGAQAFLGTRMTLYLKPDIDNTPPTLNIRDTIIQTNSIKIKLDTQDDNSGIKKYEYLISSDGGNNYTTYTGYGNTYTFENLTQGTPYNIKVRVYDHLGNMTEKAHPDILITKRLEIAQGDIFAEALYGKNGSGILYLELIDTLADQGYTLEYQLVKDGGNYSETGTWTKSQQINNLSIGDTVYARVTDGTNVANNSTIYIHNITELETFSEPKTELTEYIDSEGQRAIIPTGFRVGTSALNNTIKNGLVVENETTGDQFVWVPVKNAIYNSKDGTIPVNASEANKNKDSQGNVVPYKPMVKYQKGYSETSFNKYFEGIAYTQFGENLVKGSYAQRGATSYALDSNSYREPSLVTGDNRQNSWQYNVGTEYDASSEYYSKILGFDSATNFGEYMNSEYTNMILSIEKYGGFYVGRYETSLEGTTAKTLYNKTPMASMNWYNMYYNQDSVRNKDNPYYGNTEIVSSMIWGSQWDAMLNWILEGVDAKQVYTRTGNHSGSRRTTGVTGNDFANNIIDISSNVYEWTQDVYGPQYRVYRGGYYNVNYNSTASNRNNGTSTHTDYSLGSRFALYVK